MRSDKSNRKDRDYLQTPLTNRVKLKQKEKYSQEVKVKYIQQLQERNRKLKYEIMKINQLLDEQKNQKQKKQYKLIPNQATSDILKKQLDNAYKQIKNYQKQIHVLQSKQGGGLLTDKMARLQNIYKEKAAHLQKLKIQLSQITKNSFDNSRKLKNNAGKQQLQGQMQKLNQQIKLMREKVREADLKEKKKMENAKKQFDYIKKIQRQLIEYGVSIDQLEEIKKNNIYNLIYQQIQSGVGTDLKQKVKQKKQEKSINLEPQQQMTVERLNEMKNQIKLYKKLHLDYDKRLEVLQKQKNQQQKLTGKTKQKIPQKQEEIARLHIQIAQLKQKIKRFNSKASKPGTQQTIKKQMERLKLISQRSKHSNNSIQNSIHYKYKSDHKGLASEKGIKFNDRYIIGKNTYSKIVGMKVWTHKTTSQIAGIQCIYKIGDQIREGHENINETSKKMCIENVMELKNQDYIKSISGNLSQNDILQYFVCISKQTQIGRFGMVKPTQKHFTIQIGEYQIPVCIYGSLLAPRNKKQCSLIEQIGFQIQKDK